jgi:hypothetical protein
MPNFFFKRAFINILITKKFEVKVKFRTKQSEIKKIGNLNDIFFNTCNVNMCKPSASEIE